MSINKTFNSETGELQNNKFCSNCGLKLLQNANFCHSCGIQQNVMSISTKNYSKNIQDTIKWIKGMIENQCIYCTGTTDNGEDLQTFFSNMKFNIVKQEMSFEYETSNNLTNSSSVIIYKSTVNINKLANDLKISEHTWGYKKFSPNFYWIELETFTMQKCVKQNYKNTYTSFTANTENETNRIYEVSGLSIPVLNKEDANRLVTAFKNLFDNLGLKPQPF